MYQGCKAPLSRQALDTLLIPKSVINKESKGYHVLLLYAERAFGT